MSGLLESVLDPDRRAACAFYDERDRMSDNKHFGTPLTLWRGPTADDLMGPEQTQEEPDPFTDVDGFTHWLGQECQNCMDVSDAADRALRMPSRLAEADPAVVFCAAMLSAQREDADDTARCMLELIRRYRAL